MAITEPHGGEGSAVCARGGDTSSRRWLQSWPRFSTSAPRGRRTARTGEGARDELHGHAPEDAPSQAAGTQYFAMDVDDEPAAGGSRPDRLPDVSGPQERVQRRTVQQIVDYPSLPIIDDPEPLMVEQSVEVLRFFLTNWPVGAEQVRNCEARQAIEVPKIITEDVPMARGLACYADGGTAGGSADDHFLFVAAAGCGAER